MAYDSDRLDEALKVEGIEMIAPAGRTAGGRLRGAAGFSGGTGAAGRWRGSSDGCRASGASSFDTSTTPRTS